MNKKLSFNLLLLLLTVSLVSCGNANTSSTASTQHLTDDTKNSSKDSVKTVSPPGEDEVKVKQSDNSPEKTIPKNNQDDTPNKSDQEYSTKNGVFMITNPNTIKDVCEFDLAGIYSTPKIEPLNNSGNYSHIDIKNNDNTYIDVIIDVKNLNNKPKLTSDLITAKIKIKTTEYPCFSVAENAANTDLAANDLINPLEKREIHYVAEVPRTEATGQVEVTLTINGKNYSNKLILDL